MIARRGSGVLSAPSCSRRASGGKDGAMRDDHCSTAADGFASGALDRRRLLTGAAGALLGIALSRPSLAGARAASSAFLADARFDPALARRLQQVLEHSVAASNGRIPGVILPVERAGPGNWTGTAGLGRLHPKVAIRPGDRFRAGS